MLFYCFIILNITYFFLLQSCPLFLSYIFFSPLFRFSIFSALISSFPISVTFYEPLFCFYFFLFCQVNILVMTRVLVITISTAKRRSTMLAMGRSPMEQSYEQIRYQPQGGTICSLFKDYSPEPQALNQTSWGHRPSNRKKLGDFILDLPF